MGTPAVAPETPKKEFNWKLFFIKAAGLGFGAALMLTVVVGVGIWYMNRPKPPKPWNTSALVAKEAPSFDSRRVGDSKEIEFIYLLENATDADYEISSDSNIRITVRDKQGVFAATKLTNDFASLELPIFIPARQKAYVTFSIKKLNKLPDQGTGEAPEAYHERIRAYIETLDGVGSFVLFDEAKRYQIELPRWLSKAPPKKE